MDEVLSHGSMDWDIETIIVFFPPQTHFQLQLPHNPNLPLSVSTCSEILTIPSLEDPKFPPSNFPTANHQKGKTAANH